jgi:hypothetical protein
MSRSELDLFRLYCKNSPSITVEKLKADQTIHDFVKEKIVFSICENPKLPFNVIQWLFEEYPEYIIQNEKGSPIEFLISNINLTIKVFTLIVDHLINHINFLSIHNNLDKLVCAMFNNRTFDGPMLNYLYQRNPQLNIMYENACGQSPLFFAINNSSRLLELLQVIKSYEPAHSRTQIRIKYTNIFIHVEFSDAINNYAQDPDQSTICALVGLCGELFSLIRPKYLTQDICNQFYSSKYFCWSQDKESLIKLIPEQFPRKPCRLWRN